MRLDSHASARSVPRTPTFISNILDSPHARIWYGSRFLQWTPNYEKLCSVGWELYSSGTTSTPLPKYCDLKLEQLSDEWKSGGDEMPAELGRIDLGDVTPHNIKLLRKVNTVVFPVSYHDKFYKVIKQYLPDPLTVFSKRLSRMCLNLVSWRSWRTSTTLWLGRSVVEWTCKAPAGRFSSQGIQISKNVPPDSQ